MATAFVPFAMTKFLRAALLLTVSATATAQAVTIDFESLPANNEPVLTFYGPVVTVDGFRFDQTGSEFFTSKSDSEPAGYNYTGSKTLGSGYIYSVEAIMTRADSTAFDVLSLDVANGYRQGAADNLPKGGVSFLFRGRRENGTTVSQVYTTLFTDDLQPVALTGFNGIVSFSYGPVGSGLAAGLLLIDNVQVTNPTPEPASLAALGIGLVAALRRRRR